MRDDYDDDNDVYAPGDKMDDETLQSIVTKAVEDAVDFIESDIAPARNKGQRYYEGEVDIGHEAGRSKVVATKIRDTVRTIQPNLLRIFLSSADPVEFVARKPQDVSVAEQATQYVGMEFERNDGYSKLSDAMLDALTKKVGFIKAWWDEAEEIETYRFTNLTEQELALLDTEDDVEIIEQEAVVSGTEEMLDPQTGEPMTVDPQTGEPLPTEETTYKVTVERRSTTGCLKFDTIPPEEFFIDSGATCLDDAYIYGHTSDMRVSDLVAMGITLDQLEGLGSAGSEDDDGADEKYERANYSVDTDGAIQDESMRVITITECYMKVDMEGEGEARMHKFLLGGKERRILDYEPHTGHSIAVFESDPQPHLFFGWSIPDILFNEQDAATSMLRGILDNIALTNDPRTEANDEMVNMDDLLNNEIGNIVRVKQMGQINALAVPFMAGDTLPAVQYFDQQIEAKTGVNSMTSAFNSSMLQNQTATGVQAATQAGANSTENIARHIAQGMKQLYQIMLNLLIENSDEPVMMRMAGNKFVPMDPRSWNIDMDMQVNVGLGTGREAEKQQALGQALQLQLQLLQGQSPLVTPENVHNTLADMLALSGVRNPDRYFTPVAPMDPNAPPQGGAPEQDPQAQAFIQAEQIKAQSKGQSDQMSAMIKAMGMKMDDDRKRDEMEQNLYLEVAKVLGQYGIQMDANQIKAMQAEPRDQGMMPQNMPPQGPMQ